MMNTPLLLSSMIERAEQYFPGKQVISRTLGGIQRFTYKEIAERTRRLASALEKLGMQKGDKVGTFAWNHHRHLEAYFAVPCRGALLHMVNIRLSPEHLVYVINHAEDKILLVDEDLLPLIERIQEQLETVECYVIMSDQKEVPNTTLPNAFSYEALLDVGDPTMPFLHDLDENTPAGMCYTSATTGMPKGVIYTHRSLVLHTLSLGLADSFGIREEDVIMPVVPMFHVNAWGMPYAGTWFGATQVYPGPGLSPAVIAQLIEEEKVTVTAGVPTIWLGLLKELEENPRDVSSIRGLVSGGSAAPKGMIRAFIEKHQIPFYQGYGMTETSPLVSLSKLTTTRAEKEKDQAIDIIATQGLVVPGLEVRVVNEDGDVPRDSKTMGELIIRGPWIADSYYRDDRSKNTFKDGWLYTGDIAVQDEHGYIQITDRTKDLIKSGGEWISSVNLENALMSHEAIFEAAVIAVPHEKWQERPVACIVLKDAYKQKITKEEIIDYLKPQFAKWWLPDEIIFMDEIPKTSVGKFLKRELREQLKDFFVKP
ncbi:fatty-acyl-CoA synthase [Oikeobacillus pervagus]|uniref:Fatty-acyl-CoA synthase n=1 Tax=Oikeobacillus pervagus TaxID=1325931 RepID=A0AAJ1T5A2_9BACI|nr:long-chain fatty acid--CoA ligase [Oikeobacillus pervagus]MDQ0215481.1 fatty-acyl-CoA synthase [Oikeobacillus pervagus]